MEYIFMEASNTVLLTHLYYYHILIYPKKVQKYILNFL